MKWFSTDRRDNSLCKTCRPFILPLIDGKLETFKSIRCGTLQKLQFRKTNTNCSVCRLLLDLVERQFSAAYPASLASHLLLQPSIDSGGYFFRAYLEGVELGSVHCVKNSFVGRCMLAYQSSREPASKLVKTWLEDCETHHGEACSVSIKVGLRYLESHPLILVDCVEEKLVLDHSSVDSRYIALSYVWGQVPAIQTTGENLKDLQRCGSLSEKKVQLPSTIRDAMNLVCAIGERYLWVDTLCIIQDDEMSKKMYINRMDIVYHCALLTVIAMEGSDSNTGLSRMHAEGQVPKLHTKIGDTTLFVGPASLRGNADASRYETRGWTLQERVLSKRCIYFTSQEMIFQCKTNINREANPIFSVLRRDLDFEPTRMMNPIIVSAQGKILNEEAAYFRLVESYTKRDLTFAFDKLNAFRGMQNLFSATSSADLDIGPAGCGMPGKFWNGLLWAPAAKLLTRRPREDCGDNTPPSWSWVAWKGPVVYPIAGSISDPVMRRLTGTAITFDYSISFTAFKIRQIRDKNNRFVPGCFLDHAEMGKVCGVFYDFDTIATKNFAHLRLVFHSFMEVNYESGMYDGPPPTKFRIGSYMHTMERNEMTGHTLLVNALVVYWDDARSGEVRHAERVGLAQIDRSVWEKLPQDKQAIELR